MFYIQSNFYVLGKNLLLTKDMISNNSSRSYFQVTVFSFINNQWRLHLKRESFRHIQNYEREKVEVPEGKSFTLFFIKVTISDPYQFSYN